MNEINKNTVVSAERELIISRVFNVPRELVWEAWTNPERVKLWWGPKDFTSPVCKIDLRSEGEYLYCMRSPEGRYFWNTGIFCELNPPEKISCTSSFSDEQGNIVSAEHYGLSPEFPLELLVTAIFEELEDKTTRLTLRHSGIPEGEFVELTRAGWNESLDKLAESLTSLP